MKRNRMYLASILLVLLFMVCNFTLTFGSAASGAPKTLGALAFEAEAVVFACSASCSGCGSGCCTYTCSGCADNDACMDAGHDCCSKRDGELD